MINFNEYEELVEPYQNTIDEQGIVIDKLLKKIKELKEENKELKMQLYSDDQIRVKCPHCGGKIIVNECRVVWELQSKINKAIEFMNKWGIQPDYDMSVEMREYEEFQKLLEILKGEENEKNRL